MQELILGFVKNEENLQKIEVPKFYNIDFWFSEGIAQHLAIIKHFIYKIEEYNIKRLFLLPFSETVRECSYTRNNEFKLYKMKIEDILIFNPDVFNIFFTKLEKVLDLYERFYLPKLTDAKIEITYNAFKPNENYFDVVLTSPPYGDSKTTVAYGQFSLLSNEWLGIDFARRVDYMLMGGKTIKTHYNKGVIKDYIEQIKKESIKRSLEVSSFYFDLEKSIYNVAKSIKIGGIAIYVIGNRCVKSVQLPTDQFTAEKFEENGFKHLFTYKRLLANKAMPSQNSPTNKPGQRKGTMTEEWIVVSEKVK